MKFWNWMLIIQKCPHMYGLLPVSYTHLDVYKRQVLAQADDLVRIYWSAYRILSANRDERAGPMLDAACAHVRRQAVQIFEADVRQAFLHAIPIPVSYTHLDVYKRQQLRRGYTSSPLKCRQPHFAASYFCRAAAIGRQFARYFPHPPAYACAAGAGRSRQC